MAVLVFAGSTVKAPDCAKAGAIAADAMEPSMPASPACLQELASIACHSSQPPDSRLVTANIAQGSGSLEAADDGPRSGPRPRLY